MSLAVLSMILLVPIIAIPIRVFGEAAGRNPNRPEGEEQGELDGRDRRSGPGRD